ncbi:MAG: hypothetical protein GX115_02770 [Ruminiclostridium sp.]|nr:hypothetical protein [Ruminiclostridium sp.]
MNILTHGKRRIAIFLLCIMLLAVIGQTPAAAAVKAGDYLYSEGFESQNTLTLNGQGTIELTDKYAGAGKRSLSVSPTAINNYSGAALLNETLETPMMPTGQYKLTAKVFSADDATMGVRVETRDSTKKITYGSVGGMKVTLKAGQWVDIVMDFTVPEDHDSVIGIVFHNADRLTDLTFCLDEVKLQVITLPVPVQAKKGPEIKELLAFRFDDKAAHESLFTPGSSSKIEWVNKAGIGKDDNTALKVTHIDGETYTSAYNAIRLTLKEPLPAGGIYNVSVWFYAPAEGNEGKRSLTGPGIVLNEEYASNQFKLPAYYGTLPLDDWKHVNVQTPLMENPLKTIDFRLVVNDERKHADVWYIDEIVVSQVGELQKIETPEWDLSLPSLTEAYENYFDIGNVINTSQTEDAALTAMFSKQYNVVTAENEMKPQSLSPQKGKYNYDSADKIINWAEANKIKVHGHTLVWHSQSAQWLTFDDENQVLTRAEAKANLEDYITNVAGHFKGKVVSWDVVNEAFSDSASSNWKEGLRKDSPWYLAYDNGADASKGESGADYLYDAFVLARLADPTATLYYNDYNETDAPKREAIAAMAEELNKMWKNDSRNTQPDRLLVEGLGMQAHYWTENLKPLEVDATIARFAATGAKVIVTELDIPYGSYGNQKTTPLSEAEELQQAQLYAQVFEVYKKYADHIDRVTFWGKADPQSWRSQGSPLLFDKTFAAKQSFYAVLDSEGFLLKNWKSAFKDVTANDWFFTDVAYCTMNKLTQGTGFSTYSPASQVTWGQLLVILYRLDGQTGVTVGQDWNLASDGWAVANGLAKLGFKSDAQLNRQDMAVILQRYLEYSETQLKQNKMRHIYEDDAKIDAQAKPAVYLLYNSGIITGKPGNLFDPAGYTNRAEIAAILHRLVKAMKASE